MDAFMALGGEGKEGGVSVQNLKQSVEGYAPLPTRHAPKMYPKKFNVCIPKKKVQRCASQENKGCNVFCLQGLWWPVLCVCLVPPLPKTFRAAVCIPKNVYPMYQGHPLQASLLPPPSGACRASLQGRTVKVTACCPPFPTPPGRALLGIELRTLLGHVGARPGAEQVDFKQVQLCLEPDPINSHPTLRYRALGYETASACLQLV